MTRSRPRPAVARIQTLPAIPMPLVETVALILLILAGSGLG